MPKIIQNKNGGSIIFDERDWLAGINTDSSSTGNNKYPGNRSMSGVSALRELGFITPSPLQSAVTNAAQITSIIRGAEVVGDYAYLISGGDLVHKLSTLISGTISTTAPFPHTIDHGHSSETGNDIAVYYTGSTQRIFYSFADATDWDVGIYNIVADTFDDDFMSTVPASPLAAPYLTGGVGYPHPMIVGDDDILYIGDRNFVHAYDGQTGANGTFYPAVLTLPTGYIITSFTTTQDINLAIGAYMKTANATDTFNRGAAKVWIWNYLALDPDYSRDLRDNYVSELVQWGGTIAAFTSGRKTLSDAGIYKLQALNGSQFEVVKTWNTGGLPIRGGVDSVSNDLYWNSASRVYAYTKRPDGSYMLNIESQSQDGTSGMLKFLTSSGTIHRSWGTGASNGGLEYSSSGYVASGSLVTQPAIPEFDVRQQGKITQVTAEFQATFSGGRTIEIIASTDQASNFTTGELTALTSVRKVKYTTNSDGTPLGKFNKLYLTLNFGAGSGSSSAPVLSWVRFDFDTINVGAS